MSGKIKDTQIILGNGDEKLWKKLKLEKNGSKKGKVLGLKIRKHFLSS